MLILQPLKVVKSGIHYMSLTPLSTIFQLYRDVRFTGGGLGENHQPVASQ
jgi:hypothetical protein